MMLAKTKQMGARIVLQKAACGRLESSSYARIGGALSKEPEASSKLAKL
jgi:hypothetical protein